MNTIIASILDSDLYKLSMQMFVLQQYPEVDVTYVFNNRSKDMKFTSEAVEEIQRQIASMANLKLKDWEYDYLKVNLPFLPITYRQYLAAYQFNPNQVKLWLDDDKQLQLKIEGKWRDTILWEVPLMAIISEVYFKMVDTDWNMDGQFERIKIKAQRLSDAGCIFADFGSRRRRSYQTQSVVVETMKNYRGFVGTSNPDIARIAGVKALGTVAHESIMATSVLESLNHPNKVFMEKWTEVYKGDLGTMLPDTYGIESFLKDFSLEKAMLWSGVRHDSGDPYVFTDKIVEHYKKMRIDPTTKTIIFSDGLDVDTAIKINEYCKNKVRCSFGIGTHLTNDFRKTSTGEKSKALNMVIKLASADGIPVVKLSDSPGKAIGDPKMVDIMKYLHFGM